MRDGTTVLDLLRQNQWQDLVAIASLNVNLM